MGQFIVVKYKFIYFSPFSVARLFFCLLRIYFENISQALLPDIIKTYRNNIENV